MAINHNKLLQGYENMQLYRYGELPADRFHPIPYAELSEQDVPGVLKASYIEGGRLMQVYTEQDNHVGLIAATRLGKTTSYIMPFIMSQSGKQKKRSMLISDPKGELYRCTADKLLREGYEVKLINFRDHRHSECWNVLSPIYRKYQSAYAIYDEVRVVDTKKGLRNCFRGRIYDDENELRRDVDRAVDMAIDEVGNDIDNLAGMFVTTEDKTDPYWEDSARDVFKAFLWAMLEDSRKENLESREPCEFDIDPVTEETFSFNTMLSILEQFNDDNGSHYDDGGYFSRRGEQSMAYRLAKNNFLENGHTTRKCIMSMFNAKIAVFRDCAMRLITSCNSFDMQSIASEKPVAVFINYRDELKTHYQIISLFVQDAYRTLIEKANGMPSGKLDIPYYFILDEFGNFPAIRDFETTISACAGRNIFFVLAIQSYAQLNSVYGNSVAEIIRDNLNVHVFLGSNNPKTLEEFSEECGRHTRISPLSALSGAGEEIENYQIETIPLIPRSVLSHFEPGECIVTEANSGYVLWSRLERYYNCPELTPRRELAVSDYVCSVDPFDRKYSYVLRRKKSDGWL